MYGVGGEPDPRFSLANERTALAGLRTSLGVVAAGVALASLAAGTPRPGASRAVALLACIVGAGLAVVTMWQWARAERAMRLRQPLPAPVLLCPAMALVVVLGVVGAGLALVELLRAC